MDFNIFIAAFSLNIILLCFYIFWKWKEDDSINKFAKKAACPEKLVMHHIFGHTLHFIGDLEETLDILTNCVDGKEPIYKINFMRKYYFIIACPKIQRMILNRRDLLTTSVELESIAKIYLEKGQIFDFDWKVNNYISPEMYTEDNLNICIQISQDKNKTMCNTLKENPDLFDRLLLFANFDIIHESVIGVPTNFQKGFQTLPNPHISLDLAARRVFNIFLRQNWIFDRTKFGQQFRSSRFYMKTLHEYLKRIISQKFRNLEMAESTGPFSKIAMLDLFLIKNKYDDIDNNLIEELADDFFLIVMTSSQKIATKATFCILVLAMHEDIQEKAYEELKSIKGKDSQLTLEMLNRMTYLDSIIEETERLFPVYPIMIRKLQTDFRLGNLQIPTNSEIIINLLNIQRSENFCKDPLEFNPERKCKEAPYIVEGHKLHILVKLALKVQLLILIEQFHMKTDLKSIKDIKLKYNILLKPVEEVKIKLRSREQINNIG